MLKLFPKVIKVAPMSSINNPSLTDLIFPNFFIIFNTRLCDNIVINPAIADKRLTL